jgi:hypothetical protein
MLVHSVYFWMKDGASESDLRGFREGLQSLEKIESVNTLYVGTPSATDRPAVDRSYDFALTVVVENTDKLQGYLVDPLHTAFVERYGSLWERIIVYDAE